MGCAGCAMQKGPSRLRSPSNPRGPQQSEGPSAIWRPPAIWRAPTIWGVTSIWGAPSYLRGSSNPRGPQQSEGLSAIWKAPTIWGPYQPEGPPAIWGPRNLRSPWKSDGPPAIWGPQQLRVGPLRAVVISLNLSFKAVNEVNHFRNCSTARWLYYALSFTFSDVCTAPHAVFHPDGLGGNSPPRNNFNPPPKLSRQQCCVQGVNLSAPPKFEIPLQSQGIWMKHCPHVVADVASDCCDIRTIIFKIKAHQKLHEVLCQKSGWATWQCG